jgi:glycosyltransferase involved in cell wall biosynthesis
MKLSIIICFLDSHEAVKRQVKYFHKMHLPNDIEFVFVDDGSKPEHKQEDYHLENLRIIHTYDFRPWTQGIARNTGVRHAEGEYVLCTDIDHILSKEAIMFCYSFTKDKVIFPRYLAVLTEEGNLTQDVEIMKEYGLDEARLKTKRGLYASYHGNTYCMRRELFWELGGNDERHCQYLHHAAERKGEDSVMNTRYNHWALKNNGVCEVGPKIYCFTNGRYNINHDPNPHGLFHTLSYL